MIFMKLTSTTKPNKAEITIYVGMYFILKKVAHSFQIYCYVIYRMLCKYVMISITLLIILGVFYDIWSIRLFSIEFTFVDVIN